MKLEVKEMDARHYAEKKALRESCKHDPKHLKIIEDSSSVGWGGLYPNVKVICRNCGTMKVIFNLDNKKRKTVKKKMKRQGFKDERCNLIATYAWNR